ncbi:MAG: 3-dehydroquinate synthase, partial [Acidobacteriota bacterium]|nr:3-dehydroquinate synthase [Acidobacteriota bacterium]
MRVRVDLGERSYDVEIAAGARRLVADVIAARAPRARAAALVTSPALVDQPWFDLDPGLPVTRVVVPDGEAAKTPAVLAEVLEQFAAGALSRDDVVVSVGGGALSDLAGFAAAVYLRGVAVVHVPTTLVAQVDAAIGGKTGVDLRAGKNLMGAFHQPIGVLCDTETLATLPERERRAGLGEVAKCWLLVGRDAPGLASATLEDMMAVALGLKARAVSADEHDAGPRALLNYGHTLAHALETYWSARDPQRLRHGEAVAIGVAFAARLARALGRVDAATVEGHDAVLGALGLVTAPPRGPAPEELVEIMRRDKKAHHDLTFVLAGPEGFEVVAGVDPATVVAVLER